MYVGVGDRSEIENGGGCLFGGFGGGNVGVGDRWEIENGGGCLFGGFGGGAKRSCFWWRR